MTTNVVLPVYVADAALIADGVNLPPFQANASLGGSVELDLASFVAGAAPPARWVAPFEMPGEAVFGIDAVLPGVTANLWAPTLSASLSVPTASLTGYMSFGTMGAVLPRHDATLSDGAIVGSISAVVLPTLAVALAVDEGQTIAGSIPLLTTDLSGIMASEVSIRTSLPMPLSAIDGGMFEFAASIPLLDGYLGTFAATTARIDAQLPWMQASNLGVNHAYGEAAATLPVHAAALSATRGIVAALDADIPALFSDVDGAAGVIARISVEVTVPSVDFSGLTRSSATITASLPRIDGRFDATGVVAQVATYVVNTITNALSTYESFPFNSFAEIDGKYYGAGPSGIFELAGDKDAGVTNIDAVITTGQDHFASEMQKRVSDFFIGMRAAGDITLRVMVDENDPLEYTLSPLDIETLKQRRTLIGKGAKGKYWQFELSNVDGCDFDFDSFNVAVVPLSRRL